MRSSRPVERILRRGPLVALCIGLAQALLLVLGWFYLYQSTHERVADGVEDLILRGNVQAARSLVAALGSFPDGLVYGGPDWERAQNTIENVDLGGGGFACLLDPQGYIACHPELRENPDLRSVNLGHEPFEQSGGGEVHPLHDVINGRVTSGSLRYEAGGKHYVSTWRDAGSGVQLLVQQPVSGLTAASKHVTAGLVSQMMQIGAGIFLLTAILGGIFMRTHDRAMLRWNQDLEARVEQQTDEIVRSHRAILYGIAKLSEYRDTETGLHVERMCAYSGTIARELARRGAPIDQDWIEDLELAASLHDIGKVAIPDQILRKPGPLTTFEFEHMKRHAEAGAEALRAVRERVGPLPLLDLGIEIAGCHHERFDGTGYPNQLAGEAIPLSARIVAVADVFDALMSKRVYKAAIDFDQVRAMLEEGRGTHFDPAVVDAFQAVAHEMLEIGQRMQDAEGQRSLVAHREHVAA